jgi:DNA-binding NarL/FixJ family response regulator
MSEKLLSCVLLADGHTELAEAVRGLLETVFETVIMVADEASLLEGARRLQPDVAVVNLSLAQNRGLDWLRAVRERCPELKLVVISDHSEQSVRQAAEEAGADAYVLKYAIATGLLPAIDRVRGASTGCTEGDERT